MRYMQNNTQIIQKNIQYEKHRVLLFWQGVLRILVCNRNNSSSNALYCSATWPSQKQTWNKKGLWDKAQRRWSGKIEQRNRERRMSDAKAKPTRILWLLYSVQETRTLDDRSAPNNSYVYIRLKKCCRHK